MMNTEIYDLDNISKLNDSLLQSFKNSSLKKKEFEDKIDKSNNELKNLGIYIILTLNKN